MSLRIGIVGLGIMGTIHARYLFNHKINGARLAALCSRDAEKLAKSAADFPGIPTFLDYQDLLASRLCDAVLIVTPHLDHPAMVRAALVANHHVLVEKPLAATLSAARDLLADIARHPHLTVGIVYNQRTNPLYQKIRELLAANTLGHLTRIDWLVTNWFRTNAYYDLAPWRSTWSHGGGGLLINQSHHHLDLLHWLTGLSPQRVTAIVTAGKFHPIEVEDDVRALIEFAPSDESGRGVVAYFSTTTGEYPGTNRLEIAGTRGKLVAENQTITLTTTPADTADIIRNDPNPFATAPITTTTLTFPPSTTEYQSLTQNFVHAISQQNTAAPSPPPPTPPTPLNSPTPSRWPASLRTPVHIPAQSENRTTPSCASTILTARGCAVDCQGGRLAIYINSDCHPECLEKVARCRLIPASPAADPQPATPAPPLFPAFPAPASPPHPRSPPRPHSPPRNCSARPIDPSDPPSRLDQNSHSTTTMSQPQSYSGRSTDRSDPLFHPGSRPPAARCSATASPPARGCHSLPSSKS